MGNDTTDPPSASPIPKAPRIAPMPATERDDAIRELLTLATGSPDREMNIFSTLVRNPVIFGRWMRFGGALLGKGTLPDRERELLIMRTGWNCRSEYEWGQHVAISKKAGISDAEIDAIAAGADDPSWSPFEATLLRAADELHEHSCIGDPTWALLAERYDQAQLIEVTMVVGQYHLVAFALNSCGVQREPGVAGFPS